MKVLSLSLDNSVLDKNSALAKRLIEYGELVEKYMAIAPSAKNEKIVLSEKAEVYGSGGNGKLRQFFKIYQTGKKLWREEKYDVITVQDQYYLALIGLMLARKFKVGLEIQAHGFEKFYGLRKLIAKYVLPRANSVRCVSQRLKKQLINDFGVKEEKITVVPIYSQLATRNSSASASRRRDGRPATKKDKNFIFLTVGRLVPVKNIILQIEAMAEVVKKYPDAELWIVGDGAERKKLEDRSKKLELQKNIKFLGWQENLEKYYNAADAFVLTSDSEGWGLVVIWAAAAGLPIIMTEVGCADEVIKDGESGLIIPVGDGQALKWAMIRIIEDENLRKRLGANAKLAVEKLPTKDETLARYKKSWQIANEKL